MPRTGDERRRSRRGQRGSLSPCIGHGEPTVEEVRIYVNIVRGRRKTANTAINYVYAYKTKARAFESIKDASKVREEGRERERERDRVLRLCIAYYLTDQLSRDSHRIFSR